MKKTYIIPATAIHAVSMEGFIAASDPQVTVNRSGSVDAASVDVKRNDYNVWDEDWTR